MPKRIPHTRKATKSYDLAVDQHLVKVRVLLQHLSDQALKRVMIKWNRTFVTAILHILHHWRTRQWFGSRESVIGNMTRNLSLVGLGCLVLQGTGDEPFDVEVEVLRNRSGFRCDLVRDAAQILCRSKSPLILKWFEIATFPPVLTSFVSIQIHMGSLGCLQP